MSLLADRTQAFDSSGIRKVFDLAAKMQDPINFSIGQPDFVVPTPIKEACIEAIRAGKNAYTVTQGVPALRDKLQGAEFCAIFRGKIPNLPKACARFSPDLK